MPVHQHFCRVRPSGVDFVILLFRILGALMVRWVQYAGADGVIRRGTVRVGCLAHSQAQES